MHCVTKPLYRLNVWSGFICMHGSNVLCVYCVVCSVVETCTLCWWGYCAYWQECVALCQEWCAGGMGLPVGVVKMCNACMYVWLQLPCDCSNTSVLYQWHTSMALCDWGLDAVSLLPSAGITSATRSTHCHYTDMSRLHCTTGMKQTTVLFWQLANANL